MTHRVILGEMNTWPLTVGTIAEWTYLGIPDRLGSGRPYRTEDVFPTLEELAGEEWSAEILNQLLPAERAWAWWTRNEVYRSTQLPIAKAPQTLNHRALSDVVTRRPLLPRMTLAIVPGHNLVAQQVVIRWAGADTEQIPDHIWSAPDDPEWNTDAILSWCEQPSNWTDPTSVSHQPAERIVVMFDGQIFCALPTAAAAATLDGMRHLAARWQLAVIPGPNEYAWPVRRQG